MLTIKDFFEGAVVRLKSGGPNMTVTRLFEADSQVRVIWFDDKGVLQSETFLATCLARFGSIPQEVKQEELPELPLGDNT